MKKGLLVAACLVMQSVGGLAQKAGKPVEWPVLRRRSGRDEVLAARRRSIATTSAASRSRGSGRRAKQPRPQFGTTPGAFQNTPLMIDDVLYLSTPYNRVVALDAETGREFWALRSRRPTRTAAAERHRGSCIAASPRGATATRLRIFMNSRYRLICLDAKTGQPIESFGNARHRRSRRRPGRGRSTRSTTRTRRRRSSTRTSSSSATASATG